MSLRLKCECEFCATGKATTHNDPSHDQSLHSSFSIAGQDVEIDGGTTKAARVALAYFTEMKESFKGKSAIELGAGTGLLGQALTLFGANVVLTDQEPVLEILRENVSRNLGFSATEGKAELAGLYWGEEKLPESVASKLPFDFVICSDLIFANENIPLLLKTLDLLVPVGSPSVIYFSHIDRFSWEQSFFTGMEKAGFTKTMVTKNVDIELYTFTR